MRELSREMRALRRAVQRGHDDVWADPQTRERALLSLLSSAPIASPPPVEEPYVLALLDDDEELQEYDDKALGSAKPGCRTPNTVLAACDTTFMTLLLEARGANPNMDVAAWRALVAALAGTHPRVNCRYTAARRVTFLNEVLADPRHREHARLPRRLRELLVEYARLRDTQRPALARYKAAKTDTAKKPPAKPRRGLKSKKDACPRRPPLMVTKDPPACGTAPARATAKTPTTTKKLASLPRQKTTKHASPLRPPALGTQEPPERGTMAKLMELVHREHAATLRAIERAAERHHAQLLALAAREQR